VAGRGNARIVAAIRADGIVVGVVGIGDRHEAVLRLMRADEQSPW
jgi:hypothetical protein